MADTVQILEQSGIELYFQVRNADGEVYNTDGAAFEAYNASNWTDYDFPLTEQGDSGVYVADFPILSAGLYGIMGFERIQASPQEGDPGVSAMDVNWDGSAIVVITDIVAQVAAAILATPANTLATNASGEVVVSATSRTAIGTAVWATGTRTLTSFGTLVAEVAAAVWAAGARTLTAFGFTVTTTNGPATRAVTDKIDSMLELDGVGPAYQYTSESLDQAPSGGDATEAKQDTIIADIAAQDDGDATVANQSTIIAAIAALNDLDAAGIRAAVQTTLIDGAVDLQTALISILAMARGKVVRTSGEGVDPQVYDFYRENDSSVAFTLTAQADSSGRTN